MLTNDGKKSVIVISVLTPITTLFLGLRLARKRKGLGVDDWLLCVALLLLWMQEVGSYLLAIKGGEGKQIEDLTPKELEWLLKSEYWPELFYTVCIATIKISVLLSLKSIFGRLRWFRFAVYTLGALTSIWFIGVFFSVLFQCIPVDKAWKPLKPGHCIAFKPFLYGNSISNTILDYLILLSPVVPVLRLQMSPVQKCLVLFSFSLGSLASISSTLRAYQTRTLDLNNLPATIFKDAVWTYIEPNAGIVSACLPYLANVFGQRFLKFLLYLSSFAGKATSLLRRSQGTDHSTDTMQTPRAAHESYELSDDADQGLPDPKHGKISRESVQYLV